MPIINPDKIGVGMVKIFAIEFVVLAIVTLVLLAL
jgi:hypothetical protein